MPHAQKTDFLFRRNRRVHLNSLGGAVHSTTGSRGVRITDCSIFRKYVDHSLKMSLQGGMKRAKRIGEREIAYNVYKFMKTESEVGITCLLSKAQKRVAETTRVSRRTLCRLLKEGENSGIVVAMAFSAPCKLRPKFRTTSILDNFDEAVLRKIVHNFYLTEKQRPTMKASHSKMCESTCCGGGVSSLSLALRKM